MSRIAFTFAALLVLPVLPLPAQQPVELRPENVDIWHHRIGPEQAVHLSETDMAGTRFIGMEYVEFSVIVSANGRAESATPTTGKAHMSAVSPHLEDACAIIMARSYKPWLVDGVPTRVKVNDYVSLLPPERYGASVPFPEVTDLSTVTIGLSRTSCFGSCPSYELTISGDGTVHYMGHTSVFIQGSHAARISQDKVRELLTLFRKADFYSALDEYVGNWTDNPTQKVSLTIGPLSKTVTDYIGTDVGLPLAIRNLEQEIDEAADTQRWIAYNERTLPAFLSEHWNFASATPANTSLYAATLGFPDFADRFLAAHAPIVSSDIRMASPVCSTTDVARVRRMMQQQPPIPKPVLEQCLSNAASSANRPMFQFWLDQGADPKLKAPGIEGDWTSDLGIMAVATMGGSTEVVTELLRRGVPPPADVRGDSILTWVIERSRSQNKAALVSILLSAGADPDQRDSSGQTPLIRNALDPALVRPLLSGGAKIDARDNQGRTALIAHAFVEPMVRELLTAGADPGLVAKDGDTALKVAHQYQCPVCVTLIQQELDKRTAAAASRH